MKKQQTFTDIEYSCRKKKTRREEFLETMDEIIPWDEWVSIIAPYYTRGKRGRPPMGIERMLRMYLLQIWFNLSDRPLRMQSMTAMPCVSLPALISLRRMSQTRRRFASFGTCWKKTG